MNLINIFIKAVFGDDYTISASDILKVTGQKSLPQFILFVKQRIKQI